MQRNTARPPELGVVGHDLAQQCHPAVGHGTWSASGHGKVLSCPQQCGVTHGSCLAWGDPKELTPVGKSWSKSCVPISAVTAGLTTRHCTEPW